MIRALAGLLLGISAVVTPTDAASDLAGFLQPGAESNYDASPIVAPGAHASTVPGGAVSAAEDAALAALSEAFYGYDKHSNGALAAAAPGLGAACPTITHSHRSAEINVA